ncbi:ATP-grasp domain-containing protein [Kitasatospora sp. NPDC056327]|uniref:ATP-grasp domain-containing protein n=1 Tax=Kitasatospora sp. NPDC056327 TaxID=3345785 RepID=UPI0035D90DF2
MPAFRVAVVDAYGTASGFAGAFGALDGEVIQVRSTAAHPPGVDPADDRAFGRVLVHDGDPDALAARLAALDTVAVLAGRETGVELADTLSERLGLPTNGTALSSARRDKYVQIETIKAQGVPGMRQLRTGDEAELLAWHEKLGGTVVVKPLRGYWGAGVSFCDLPRDSAAALRGLRSRRTLLGEPVTEVVAQEYLVGAEYIVNTVSCAGAHRLTDAWRTERIEANGVRDLVTAQVLLRSDEEPVGELFDYGRRVLDSLGIRYGAAHLEIKLTPDGPRLVEAGARVSGLPYYTAEVLGEGQLEWSVDAYVRPDRFRARADRPYRRRHAFAWAALVAPASGRLRGYRALDRIERLAGFRSLTVLVRPGDTITATTYDREYPATLTLSHPVDAVLQRDLNTVRYLDGPGMYDITPPVGGVPSAGPRP